MNKTILHGKWRQVRGGLKTSWGRLTDDEREVFNGKIDQMVGLIQERYGYTQQGATRALSHYMHSYGKTRRRHTSARTRFMRPAIASIALAALVTAAWVALTRTGVIRQETSGRVYADTDPFGEPGVRFE